MSGSDCATDEPMDHGPPDSESFATSTAPNPPSIPSNSSSHQQRDASDQHRKRRTTTGVVETTHLSTFATASRSAYGDSLLCDNARAFAHDSNGFYYGTDSNNSYNVSEANPYKNYFGENSGSGNFYSYRQCNLHQIFRPMPVTTDHIRGRTQTCSPCHHVLGELSISRLAVHPIIPSTRHCHR